MTLLFATNNTHKFKEVSKILPSTYTLLSLRDVDFFGELEETGTTVRSNASQKARYVHDKFGMNCFADDTGLEVLALGGRPGVYSARFAGPEAIASENIKKLLIELKGIEDRRASFRTVISLFLDDKEYFFEGTINGTITHETRGDGGFGYDPLFIPDGMIKTLAEMSDEEKNNISHRYVAINKLVNFLRNTVKIS
jgi:XTP/dITP diphosphohydrolase